MGADVARPSSLSPICELHYKRTGGSKPSTRLAGSVSMLILLLLKHCRDILTARING
jgi:hypothetical protein